MSKTVKRKFLEFLRGHNLSVGHCVPEKPFRFSFLQSLNPKEQQELEVVLQALVDEDIVEHRPSARFGSISLFLTQSGFDLLYADDFSPDDLPQGTLQMTGHTFNFNGPSNIQIGDYNTQQIQHYFQALEKVIDGSDATDDEKAESKSLLLKVSENPLLSSLITGVGSLALKSVLGIP